MSMAERAARGSKAKALAALAAIREADRPPLPEDHLPASSENSRPPASKARSRQA
jgi:hypothetical protein